MSSDFDVSPRQIRGAASSLAQTGETFTSNSQALLAELSDTTFLGTNDTLGSIASMLYSLALSAFQESMDSVSTELGAQAELLDAAAGQYEAGDATAESISNQVGI